MSGDDPFGLFRGLFDFQAAAQRDALQRHTMRARRRAKLERTRAAKQRRVERRRLARLTKDVAELRADLAERKRRRAIDALVSDMVQNLEADGKPADPIAIQAWVERLVN